ncbi:MAG: hypothetical protein AAF556_11310 [Pseudomonadota bacterium]
MHQPAANPITEAIIEAADLAIERARHGRLGRSFIMIGRGTHQRRAALNRILLNTMDDRAYGLAMRGGSSRPLAEQISRGAHMISTRLAADGASVATLNRVIKGFRRAHFRTDIRLAETEIGVADSGVLDQDFPDLLEQIAKQAKSIGKVIVLPVGEMQGFSKPELTSIIMAQHRMNQQNLPVVMFGAGARSMPRRAGQARAYAERMFDFPELPTRQTKTVTKPGPDPNSRPKLGS